MFLEFALIIWLTILACIPISIAGAIIYFLSIPALMLKKRKRRTK